jgi:hypothetical protein
MSAGALDTGSAAKTRKLTSHSRRTTGHWQESLKGWCRSTKEILVLFCVRLVMLICTSRGESNSGAVATMQTLGTSSIHLESIPTSG